MRTIQLIVLLVFVADSMGQTLMPGIPYQAVVRNADGTPMINTNIEMKFSIRNTDALNGVVVYQERHQVNTNNMGLMSAVIGEGEVMNGDFSQIDWSVMPKFLQVEFKGPNNADYIEMGNQQLMSVPYAMYSARSGSSDVVSVIDSVSIENQHFIFYFSDGSISDAGVLELISGCMNPSSCNYNSQAVIDNGTCKNVGDLCDDGLISTALDIYGDSCECLGLTNIPGCTNTAACNYNAVATTNDGSCHFIGSSCDDGIASTTNDHLNGQCECLGVNPNEGSGNGAVLLPGNITCKDEDVSVTGCGGQSTLTYFDKVYDLIEIGGQCWFAENLATTKFNDGTSLLEIVTPDQWMNNSLPAYANYPNYSQNAVFGMKYNGAVIRSVSNVCPVGWHVPSDCDWMYLEQSLGFNVFQQQQTYWRGENELGSKLKSVLFWSAPSNLFTNLTGFNVLPAGRIYIDGSINYIFDAAYFWTSSSFSDVGNWYRFLSSGDTRILRYSLTPEGMINNGYSIRCLKD